MAKQEDYVRTQVRLDKMTYVLLKDYCEKHKVSMNHAINELVHDSLHEDMFNADTQENKDLFIKIASKRLATLSVKEVRELCGLITHISQLKGH